MVYLEGAGESAGEWRRQEKRQHIKGMSLSSSPKGAGSYPVGKLGNTELRLAHAPEGRKPGAVYTSQLVVYRCWRMRGGVGGGGWEGEALRTEAHALVDGRYLGHVKKAESNAVFLNWKKKITSTLRRLLKQFFLIAPAPSNFNTANILSVMYYCSLCVCWGAWIANH